MRKPPLTRKVLDGISFVLTEADTVLQADSGNGAAIYDKRDHELLAAVEKWLAGMRQWQYQRKGGV